MRQHLHLLIVDRASRLALAAEIADRWFLPIVTTGEHARAGLAVLRWCDSTGVAGTVAGQWLGRMRPDAIDWLVAVDSTRQPDVSGALEWMPWSRLASSPALDGYQSWAIRRVLEERLSPGVNGPFGTLGWLAAVRRWIQEVCRASVVSVVPYRVSAYETTLGARVADRDIYFKGLPPERACEAHRTRAFAAAEPDTFAETLALRRFDDGSAWWLTAAVPGRADTAGECTARELARVQQRLLTSASACSVLQDLDGEGLLAWVANLLADSPAGLAARERCRRALDSGVKHAWIPMDIDPSNALVDEDAQVRFIDIDESYLGPAPLAMALLARRCGDSRLCRLYEQAWSPPLGDIDWTDFTIAATAIECWRGMLRVDRNSARGELIADVAAVRDRIRDRLTAEIYRR